MTGDAEIESLADLTVPELVGRAREDLNQRNGRHEWTLKDVRLTMETEDGLVYTWYKESGFEGLQPGDRDD